MERSAKSLQSSSPGGSLRIAYSSWGNPSGRPLFCVHGLTGGKADFLYIGEYLGQRGYFIVAPDLPGRGDSEFLRDPDRYCFDEYLIHLQNLLDHLALNQVDWLGVSMGGLLGMRMMEERPQLIRRLILSDIGPEVPESALDLIKGYLSLSPIFSTLDDVVAAFKQSSGTPFYRGRMNEEEWRYYSETHVRKNAEGQWVRSFDPAIAIRFNSEPLGRRDLWPMWKKIVAPTLLLHGSLSLLMTESIVARMKAEKRGAPLNRVLFPDCGHVPSLYPESQIRLLEDWLAQAAA